MPEKIIESCDHMFNEDGERIPLDEGDKEERILQNVVRDNFGKKALRSIAFAYKDYTHEEWDQIKSDPSNFDVNDELNYTKTFFSELTLISIFAMED